MLLDDSVLEYYGWAGLHQLVTAWWQGAGRLTRPSSPMEGAACFASILTGGSVGVINSTFSDAYLCRKYLTACNRANIYLWKSFLQRFKLYGQDLGKLLEAW